MEAVITNYWDILPEELHREVFFQEHKLGMSKVMAELASEYAQVQKYRDDEAVEIAIKELRQWVTDEFLEEVTARIRRDLEASNDYFVVLKGKCHVYIEKMYHDYDKCENMQHIHCSTQKSHRNLVVQVVDYDAEDDVDSDYRRFIERGNSFVIRDNTYQFRVLKKRSAVIASLYEHLLDKDRAYNGFSPYGVNGLVDQGCCDYQFLPDEYFIIDYAIPSD